MACEYIIGIDLGTTNCVVTYSSVTKNSPINLLPIPQYVGPGQYESSELMPSFLYLPSFTEISPRDISLPWENDAPAIIGKYAQARAQDTPQRVVSSVKSWFCQPNVDKHKSLLPSPAANDVNRLSLLEAYTYFFEHLKQSWSHQFPKASLFRQKIIITIPASFEPVAREMTVEAARLCDFEDVTLLEEPQAALYSWIHNNHDQWKDSLAVDDTILVIDVGGGTTDFSLIQVCAHEQQLRLERVAVGNHILLGGDNMDLLLAHMAQKRLLDAGCRLETWQFQSLIHSCRHAKEKLFSDEMLTEFPIIVADRSSNLFKNTIQTTLTKIQIQQNVIEGFFPRNRMDEHPRQETRYGLNRFALSYTQDPAITKHLAAFLSVQSEAKGAFIAPKAILFNGGVFKTKHIRQRLLEVVNHWLNDAGLPSAIELTGVQYDTSVAYGATIFGQAQLGHNIKIYGGSSHAFYIGIETPMPAIPGFRPPIEALCIAPQGMEYGKLLSYRQEIFSLVVGEPVQFHFFRANNRVQDKAGTVIHNWEQLGLVEVGILTITLSAQNYRRGEIVPVYISVMHTEIGTLELFANAIETDEQWKISLETKASQH